MADIKYRIRLPANALYPQAVTVSVGQKASIGQYYSDILPAKDFCLTDDVLRVADSCSFTVANIDGENNGIFGPGRRIEIDASDQGVANGQWSRAFTGRLTKANYGSDIGGSIIRVDCMDLGWHITSCCALPLQTTNGITLDELCSRLIDETWGFAPSQTAGTKVTIGNVLNGKLKQGRVGVQRAQPHNPLQVFPPIQVEPGQTPWQLLEEYFKRAGYLLNVGAMGDLIIFQPDYQQQTIYDSIEYHGSKEGQRTRNNVVGRPSLDLSIDGLYTESQCWSTVVIPTADQQADISLHPNAQFRHTLYAPPTTQEALPFTRRLIAVDGEAINEQMRRNRAVYGFQMGAFQSTVYECTVLGHSSKPQGSSTGAFYASDSMIPVNDTVNGPTTGAWYVQAVQKTYSEGTGPQTKLTLRLPGLLNPTLQAQISGGVGGGAAKVRAAAVSTKVNSDGSVTTVVIPKVSR